MKRSSALFLVFFLFLISCKNSLAQEKKWSQEKANAWYDEQPWLVGCNFIPSTAINQPGTEEPDIWFHDILRKDGTPYDEGEATFIQTFIKQERK